MVFPHPQFAAAAASPAPASCQQGSTGQRRPSPLLLAGGGVAALGLACVVGLAVLVALAAILEAG